MGEIQILEHPRKRGDTYFKNAAPKALKKNSYVMSMKYYFKW